MTMKVFTCIILAAATASIEAFVPSNSLSVQTKAFGVTNTNGFKKEEFALYAVGGTKSVGKGRVKVGAKSAPKPKKTVTATKKPAKKAPAKAAAGKKVAAKPAKKAPLKKVKKSAPAKKVAPKKAAPKKAAPKKVATKKVAPKKVAPKKVVSKAKTASKKVAPKKASKPIIAKFAVSAPKLPSFPSGPKKQKTAIVKAELIKAVNPISFGAGVIGSQKGKEAVGILTGGGLLLLQAVLEEGKKQKVEIPSGFDTSGKRKSKEVYVGPRVLLDGLLFAGKEALDTGLRVYDKIQNESPAEKARKSAQLGSMIKEVKGKKDKKTGKVIKKQVYYARVGNQRIKVER